MKYATPAAFKMALERRLSQRHGGAISRVRQVLVFSRFLARVGRVIGDAATLKGGLALELRLGKARTTKDIDLGLRSLSGDRDQVLARLQEAARLDLDDFMVFEVRVDPEHPTIDNDGLLYEGYRFRASCLLAGKEYGRKNFGIDVVMGEPVHGRADELIAEDWLGFAGIPPPTIRTYPVEIHVAEKLHAYTMPRKTLNSRMKDLPDLALLAMAADHDSTVLRSAIDETFRYRGTHDVPLSVPAPPVEWTERYRRLAEEEDLPWPAIADLLERVCIFLDPVLASPSRRARWDGPAWTWHDQQP